MLQPEKIDLFKLHKDEFLEPNIEIEKDEYRSFGRTARE